MNDTKAICQLCGEPMPPGEEMFNYHGYSGECPKSLTSALAQPARAQAVPCEKCARLSRALRAKDEAMGELFRRLDAAGVDCSDLIP